MITPESKVRATPRTVRVAYVIEDGTDSHNWIDAIFSDCFSRDGGRQSLIVPLVEGKISERYKTWLSLLDPDYVVLLTYQNLLVAEELSLLLGDTILLHRERKKEETEPYPSVAIEGRPGLTSLSWLPFLKTVSGFHRTPPTHILDRYPAWNDDGLIKDNFGTLFGSLYPYPMHQQLGIRALLLTPENAPENRWHYPLTNHDEEVDAYATLEKIGSRSAITTLSHLSNLSVAPYRYNHPWTNGFCLVVGDSFGDRISCWNAGLLFDNARDQRYKTLRVPTASALDEKRISNIASFLRKTNWLGSANGPGKIFVRSHSTNDPKSVENFLSLLRRYCKSTVTFEGISSVDECTPSDIAGVKSAFSVINQMPAAIEATIRESTVVLDAPQPMQLTYCAGLHPVFSEGSWFIDTSIDHIVERTEYGSIKDIWAIPTRKNLVRHFCDADGTRVRRDGQLSIPIDTTSRAIGIKQPADSAIFHSLITEDNYFDYRDIRAKQVNKIPYVFFTLSDKGSYLQGLIRLFGSIADISSIMGTHFWRKQFLSMAAPAQSQSEEVIKDIQKHMRAGDGKLIVENEASWQRLAQRVIHKSTKLKVPRHRTSYKKLLAAWTEELNAAIDRDSSIANLETMSSEDEYQLQSSLSYLFKRGVMYRGHEWSCTQCLHRNWLGIEALSDQMTCEVCGEKHQLPVDVTLDFRLNDFFGMCLREHDTISVAWALNALRKKSKRSFLYMPQIALYRNYQDGEDNARIDRELDLVCIVDGKFTLGEVKAKSELIARSDLEDLATAAIEIGADEVVLAALWGTERSMESKIKELRTLLPAFIGATSLLSDWSDEPSNYLA